MRQALALAGIGAVLGAAVAVITHFLAKRPPTGEFGVQSYQPHTFHIALVHPSWWPTLPVSVAAGLVAGLLIWLALRVAGLRIGLFKDRR
jgi:hypothetical protein